MRAIVDHVRKRLPGCWLIVLVVGVCTFVIGFLLGQFH
jgi:hypothetical protein